MSILPRTMPEKFQEELIETLVPEGIQLDKIDTLSRVAYKATYAECEWTITYVLSMSGSPEWSLIGPGIEHGLSVGTDEIVNYIKSRA